MIIEISAFRRDDGIKLLKTDGEKWILRCIYGPAWFWDTVENDWVIHTSDDIYNRESIYLSMEDGLPFYKQ